MVLIMSVFDIGTHLVSYGSAKQDKMLEKLSAKNLVKITKSLKPSLNRLILLLEPCLYHRATQFPSIFNPVTTAQADGRVFMSRSSELKNQMATLLTRWNQLLSSCPSESEKFETVAGVISDMKPEELRLFIEGEFIPGVPGSVHETCPDTGKQDFTPEKIHSPGKSSKMMATNIPRYQPRKGTGHNDTPVHTIALTARSRGPQKPLVQSSMKDFYPVFKPLGNQDPLTYAPLTPRKGNIICLRHITTKSSSIICSSHRDSSSHPDPLSEIATLPSARANDGVGNRSGHTTASVEQPMNRSSSNSKIPKLVKSITTIEVTNESTSQSKTRKNSVDDEADDSKRKRISSPIKDDDEARLQIDEDDEKEEAIDQLAPIDGQGKYHNFSQLLVISDRTDYKKHRRGAGICSGSAGSRDCWELDY